jgi:hypothetical protein
MSSAAGRVTDMLAIWLFSWLSASKVSCDIVKMKKSDASQQSLSSTLKVNIDAE